MSLFGFPVKQDNLGIKLICSALPEGTFVIIRAEAFEAISTPFEINVFLRVIKQIDVEKLVNSQATVSVPFDKDSTRFFAGIVAFASFENIQSRIKERSESILHIKVVSTVFRAHYAQRFMSFQKLSAEEIIQKVLKEAEITNVKISLQSCGAVQRIFCVQYGESDLHFVSRLMEEEGIFYYFDHLKDKDILYISDNSVSARKIKTELKIKKMVTDATLTSDTAFNISFANSFGTKKVDSFSYSELKAEVISGTASDSSFKPMVGSREFYDLPFFEKSSGNALSKISLERENSLIRQLNGESLCPEITPGFVFNISGSTTANHNGEFLAISVKHSINQFSDDHDTLIYSNSFVAIPSKVPYRPACVHLKNRIFGCQTATVTGTSGEEIFCDEEARIKVRFHWDSRVKKDENSSCWVRVAHSMAGNKFGALTVPRVGMEVMVEFINGDPDQPVVTGCLYNGLNKPPANYAKDKKTASAFYTNSSKGGKGFNELRFDDKKDEEEIFVHAQKDINIVIEDSVIETLTKGSKTVILESEKDPTAYTLTIKKGKKTEILCEGDYSITLKKGNQSITLEDGNLEISVTGSISLKATEDISIKAQGSVNIESGKAASINAKDSIKLEASKDFIVNCLKYTATAKMAMELGCTTFKLDAKTTCELLALTLKTQAKATMELSGLVVMAKATTMLQLQGTAGVSLQGAMIKLN
ncbi:MAG: type VI secretion system tip protein VgrG [Holosporales bacterium]|jgi:type VI secretion system secreted protein VgrG|nr:type VI secretion system tip protein VgrG [Holosporales bacterium]